MASRLRRCWRAWLSGRHPTEPERHPAITSGTSCGASRDSTAAAPSDRALRGIPFEGVPSARSTVSAAPATFLFADIAGFTALTEAHGDEQAVTLVNRFSSEVAEVLPRYDAEQVKSIGDAVMLRVPSPAAAIELGLHLAHDMLGDH